MPVRYDNSLAFGATHTPLYLNCIRGVWLHDCHDANLKGERGGCPRFNVIMMLVPL